MKKFAVIVAGGAGTRMGNAVPKQFMMLHGKPVLWYTIDAFLRSYADMQVALVLPHEYLPAGEEIAAMFDDSSRIQITAGGKTRFDSVKAGLQLVKEECVIFVHDGVRCLISVPLIQRCYNQALLKGSAVPAVAATDSIRIGEEDNHIVANRQQVRIVQTPQTFLSNILLPAFEQSFDESFTDEATVVEKHGTTVYLTEGDYNNIKITRPVDMMIAERIISERLLLK